ncbi:MAG TPA: DMT family transporter [Candidatus Saccharimonadales bacterium]|nr:DMT family transporter [Candidatus Saccharimonadales bacterium]
MPHLKSASYLLLVAMAGGSLTVLAKFALERMPVFGYTSVRYAISLLMIYLALRLIGKKAPWGKFKSFAPIAVMWIVTGVMFALGLQRTNATTAQFIHTAIPIVTAIFAWFILRHRLSRIQWVGVGIAFIGVLTIIFSRGSISLSSGFLGNVLVFCSVFGFALYGVLTKLPRYKHIEPLEMTFIGFCFGVPLVLPLAITEIVREGNWLPDVSPSAWVATIFASLAMVLFATGFQKLVSAIGPSFASLNQYLNPIFVIMWAALLLDERPELQALVGGAIALAGVGLVTWHQRKDDIETRLRAENKAD